MRMIMTRNNIRKSDPQSTSMIHESPHIPSLLIGLADTAALTHFLLWLAGELPDFD